MMNMGGSRMQHEDVAKHKKQMGHAPMMPQEKAMGMGGLSQRVNDSGGMGGGMDGQGGGMKKKGMTNHEGHGA